MRLDDLPLPSSLMSCAHSVRSDVMCSFGVLSGVLSGVLAGGRAGGRAVAFDGSCRVPVRPVHVACSLLEWTCFLRSFASVPPTVAWPQ